MLSDEEKEALEILNNTEWDGFMITIKNLIEKQSKEIEHWKAGMKIVEKDKNNHIERLEKEIEELKFKYQARKDRMQKEIELLKEKEKNKKALDFINNENNYFEDGENWQNILKIKEILEE